MAAGGIATAVASGDSFSLALTTSGTLVGWGRDQEGELADGATVLQSVPVAVGSAFAPGTLFAAVTAGTQQALALTSLGTLQPWGATNPAPPATGPDTYGQGLPDAWQLQYFGHLGVDPNALTPGGGGWTNRQAYQQALNPNVFTAMLAIVSGNNQHGAPNEFVPLPLIVSLTDATQSPISNAPVSFAVSRGGGYLQVSSIGTPSTTVTVLTDYNGQAKVFFRLSGAASDPNQVIATSNSGSYYTSPPFNESADAPSGSNPSPFAPSNVTGTLNSDGSMDVTWTNNADPADPDPINIQDFYANGIYHTIATAPAGATSCHIPAP